ncbi:MAG: DUF2182 domain-containing protein [Methylacidiphilales bacterium]|nr:DUF2182 domain-containing protein [Candidatus Methylacidiphilales bacterium]
MLANCDQDAPAKRAYARAGPEFCTVILLVFTTGLAATGYFCNSMSEGMSMPGGWTMSMMWMRMPGQTWLASAAMFMLMWLAMMVAMMLPSSLPLMLRDYHARRSGNSPGAMILTLLMATGYFFVWSAVGMAVYMVGTLFALATMRWTALSQATPLILGIMIFIAGCLQFMPWTMYGLRRCRGMLPCEMPPAQGCASTSWWLGISRGVSCVACCSGPTLVLLALGMMNAAVMVMVAAVITMEKLMPKPELMVRIFGMISVVTGLIIISNLIWQAFNPAMTGPQI